MSGLPRTFSGDLSTLQRRKSDSTGSSQSGLPPPPPNFPAPPAPDDDRSSQISGHSSASSNRTGEICCPHRCMHDCAYKGIHVRKTIFVIRIPCSIRTHYILRLVTTTCCQLCFASIVFWQQSVNHFDVCLVSHLNFILMIPPEMLPLAYLFTPLTMYRVFSFPPFSNQLNHEIRVSSYQDPFYIQTVNQKQRIVSCPEPLFLPSPLNLFILALVFNRLTYLRMEAHYNGIRVQRPHPHADQVAMIQGLS